MEPISRDLYKLLMAQGLSADRTAIRKARRRKATGAPVTAHTVEVRTAQGGFNRPIYLAWSNPAAIGGRTGKMRRPMLAVVK
jgi:hypothetical protein